jgi:hypothetical protein
VPNLPLAFAELLVGGVVLEAAIKGASLSDVVKGKAVTAPITGLTGNTSNATSTSSDGGDGNVGTATAADVTPPTSLNGAPAMVQKAFQRASGMAAQDGPYSQAAHASAFTAPLAAIKQAGTDCSGFVSSVLGPLGAGVLKAPQTTQTIYDQPGIQDGKGKWITIFDRMTGPVDQEHVIMSIGGQFFESGGQLGKGPSAMTAGEARSELAGGGFQIFHPAGM